MKKKKWMKVKCKQCGLKFWLPKKIMHHQTKNLILAKPKFIICPICGSSELSVKKVKKWQ